MQSNMKTGSVAHLKKPAFYFRKLLPIAFSVSMGLFGACSGSDSATKLGEPDPIVRTVRQKMLTIADGKKEICRKSESKRCLLFGESHDNEQMNYVVAEMLPDLKKAGFTHMVLEIDTTYQKFIDNYMSNDSLTSAYLSKNVPLLDFYLSDTAIVDGCRKNGISILLSDYHSPSGRWNDSKIFDYIMEKIPEGEKFIINFGSNHTRYSDSCSTLGNLLKAKFGSGVYSICIQNAGEDVFSGLEKEGYVDAKLLNGTALLRPNYDDTHCSTNIYIREFDGYLILKKSK